MNGGIYGCHICSSKCYGNENNSCISLRVNDAKSMFNFDVSLSKRVITCCAFVPIVALLVGKANCNVNDSLPSAMASSFNVTTTFCGAEEPPGKVMVTGA